MPSGSDPIITKGPTRDETGSGWAAPRPDFRLRHALMDMPDFGTLCGTSWGGGERTTAVSTPETDGSMPETNTRTWQEKGNCAILETIPKDTKACRKDGGRHRV